MKIVDMKEVNGFQIEKEFDLNEYVSYGNIMYPLLLLKCINGGELGFHVIGNNIYIHTQYNGVFIFGKYDLIEKIGSDKNFEIYVHNIERNGSIGNKVRIKEDFVELESLGSVLGLVFDDGKNRIITIQYEYVEGDSFPPIDFEINEVIKEYDWNMITDKKLIKCLKRLNLLDKFKPKLLRVSNGEPTIFIMDDKMTTLIVTSYDFEK